MNKEYRICKIPKKNGHYRKIYIPADDYKKLLQLHIPKIEDAHRKNDNTKVSYAFQSGKNCSLHAMQHVGFDFTLSLDLEDFFDSVSRKHLKGLIDKDTLDVCLIDGSPRQGLPTSPLLCDIAFLATDSAILKTLQRHHIDACYTRYADDLVFSFNKKSDARKIEFLVAQIVEYNGFKLNNGKTKLQHSKNGRVIVTGIGIDSNGIHPTRKTLKKLRAAMHQRNEHSARGLKEWSKCKFPRSYFFG